LSRAAVEALVVFPESPDREALAELATGLAHRRA
jgi:hypothetical protein